MKINFFDTKNTSRSSKARKELMEQKGPNPTDNYMGFGFDYFDNPELGIGYGGYNYDGRYSVAAKKMCSYYQLKAGDKVLEIGCAKGFLLVEFHKLGLIVSGMDLSEYAVQNAHPDIREKIQMGAALNLPFGDNEFDLVLGKEVLPHVPLSDIEGTLLECQRVSKNNLFFEIQTGSSEKELAEIMKWDNTHKILKTPDWWDKMFIKLDYPGDVNYKILMPEPE